MKKTFVTIVLVFCALLIGCSSEDRDDVIINIPDDTNASTTTTSTTTPTPTEPVANIAINDYIWKGMNQYYYWQEDVQDLADSKTDNTTEYNAFRRDS
jgi:major membrane immunogen (membrane-anchored lipoprotein)